MRYKQQTIRMLLGAVLGLLLSQGAQATSKQIDQQNQELKQIYAQLLGKSEKISKRQRKLQKLADQAAHKHGLDPYLFRALITQESAWFPKIVSSRGAIGLTQLMPSTAKAVCGVKNRQALFNPATNLDCGAKFLAQLIERFDGVKKGLCAYNAGPSRIQRLGRCPNFRVTRAYVRKIMTAWADQVYEPLKNLVEISGS